MAIEDNELLDSAIDRAFDAAEAKMAESEAQEAGSTSDLVEDVAVSEAIKDTKEASTPKPEKTRDKSGKFVKAESHQEAEEKDLSDQGIEENVDGAQEAQIETSPTVEIPFWSAQDTALLAKAPAEVQQLVAAQWQNVQQYVQRLNSESQTARTLQNRYNEVFGDQAVADDLRASGIRDGFEAAERLLAWDRVFRRDIRTGIADLMHKNGLTPYDFMDEQGNIQYQPEVVDPQIQEATSKVTELQKKFEDMERRAQEAEQRALQDSVNQWKSGKDSSGNTRKTFAEAYAPQITQAAEEIAKIQPNMPFIERINHAYEFTMEQVRKLHGVTQASQVAPSVQPQKVKAAASSVVGAPRTAVKPTRPKVKSIDEALDRAEEALGL